MVLTYSIAALALAIGIWLKIQAMQRPKPYLGAYYPVETSTYSDIYPENPDPNIVEIASLYAQLIQLFIDMRYVNIGSFDFAPHEEPRINLSHPAKYGFVKNVVDLYQMIPHPRGWVNPNWNYGSDGGEFVLWGEFLGDLRDGEGAARAWADHVIDPLHWLDLPRWNVTSASFEDDDNQPGWHDKAGPYIKPVYAVLSSLGNHGSVMILNTKNWHMWLIEQSGDSSDPVFRGIQRPSHKEPVNRHDLDQFPSRPAVDFLRDIIQRFRDLEWLPGGLYGPDWGEEYTIYQNIYRRAGWPDDFQAEVFDDLHKEALTELRAFHDRTTPLDQLHSGLLHQRYLAEHKQQVLQIKEEIADIEIKMKIVKAMEDMPKLQDRLNELQDRLKQSERIVCGPTSEEWIAGQAALEQKIRDIQAEENQLLNREGRFSGISDADYQTIVEDPYYSNQIKGLQILLEDTDEVSREERIDRETRKAAEAVDQADRERWEHAHLQRQEWDARLLQQWRTWYETGRYTEIG